MAKVGEAEVMIASGTPDLLVAYPVIGRSKLERLTEVARKTRVTVALDSSFAARQLSEAAREAQVNFGVLAEVDVGLGRVGVTPGEELLQLAQAILRLPRLTFGGHHVLSGSHQDDGRGRSGGGAPATGSNGSLDAGRFPPGRYRGSRCERRIDPHFCFLPSARSLRGLSEIRPGTYVYNDVNTVRSGGCGWEDCAVSIMTTVVSTARKGPHDRGWRIEDILLRPAGGIGRDQAMGRVVEAPECLFHNMNEEHGYVDIRKAEHEFSIGDRVRNHSQPRVCGREFTRIRLRGAEEYRRADLESGRASAKLQ